MWGLGRVYDVKHASSFLASIWILLIVVSVQVAWYLFSYFSPSAACIPFLLFPFPAVLLAWLPLVWGRLS